MSGFSRPLAELGLPEALPIPDTFESERLSAALPNDDKRESPVLLQNQRKNWFPCSGVVRYFYNALLLRAVDDGNVNRARHLISRGADPHAMISIRFIRKWERTDSKARKIGKWMTHITPAYRMFCVQPNLEMIDVLFPVGAIYTEIPASFIAKDTPRGQENLFTTLLHHGSVGQPLNQARLHVERTAKSSEAANKTANQTANQTASHQAGRIRALAITRMRNGLRLVAVDSLHALALCACKQLKLAQATKHHDVYPYNSIELMRSHFERAMSLIAFGAVHPAGQAGWLPVLGPGAFRSPEHERPISVAAYIFRSYDDKSSAQLIETLIMLCGISPDTIDEGYSLLQMASMKKAPRTIDALMRHGATAALQSGINCPIFPGKTAAEIASLSGHHQIAGMLQVWSATHLATKVINQARSLRLVDAVAASKVGPRLSNP